MNAKSEILIYQTANGNTKVDVRLDNETVWLNQYQLAELFQTDRTSIVKHIKNVYESGELIEKSTCAKIAQVQKEGSRKVTRDILYYNLDMIISVGYRVNSLRGTQFRIWATRTLKEHLLKGYTLNQKRLAETGVKELEVALQFIKQASSRRQLTSEEAQGLLEVITKYAKSWLLLKSYDEDNLPQTTGQAPKFSLTYKHALDAIIKLKEVLMDKDEASDIFGNEREHGLDAILGNLEQSFGDQELYPIAIT